MRSAYLAMLSQNSASVSLGQHAPQAFAASAVSLPALLPVPPGPLLAVAPTPFAVPPAPVPAPICSHPTPPSPQDPPTTRWSPPKPASGARRRHGLVGWKFHVRWRVFTPLPVRPPARRPHTSAQAGGKQSFLKKQS